MLTLARSQRGIGAREELDLGHVTDDVMQAITRNGVRLERDLEHAETAGDPRLVERLVANLLENALKYNQDHGWVKTWTGVRDGRPTLEVTNTGPVVGREQVKELIEPFRRLDGERSHAGDPVSPRGLGLGLSIVDAISAAHGARMAVIPRPEGGLRVVVSFPPRPVASLD